MEQDNFEHEFFMCFQKVCRNFILMTWVKNNFEGVGVVTYYHPSA